MDQSVGVFHLSVFFLCYASERNVRRMTRALKNTVLQQHMVPVDKALQILNEESPPLVVDRDKLQVCHFAFNFPFFFSVRSEEKIDSIVFHFNQELLDKVVAKTEGYEVYKLEKLYAVLCQSIYRHRHDYNKTALIQVGSVSFTIN